MKTIQFIKSLNNTEIGKGRTNESYVLVSKSVKEIEKLFDSANRKPRLINLKNGGELNSVHITVGHEFRINGLGDFYRDNNVNAGDEIFFERREENNDTKFFINILNKSNVVVFQKNSKGFEVLNSDRLKTFSYNNINYKNNTGTLTIDFKESSKKRADSPTDTDFYTLKFNQTDLLNDINSNEYFELTTSTNKNVLKKVLVWQLYEFKTN
jgi:hypothetical protein